MARQTFILLLKKTYRHTIRVYLKDIEGKVDKRNLTFTTEHKVSEKQRNTNARTIPAEFSTPDPSLIKALYMDTGYGKTFTHKDDPEGKRKQERFSILPADDKKIALKNLFAKADLDFDESKSVGVLTEEYNIHITALTGTELKVGEAKSIPHVEVDLAQDRADDIAEAHAKYKSKYGEDIPEEYANDTGILSMLIADPNWDAKAYIAEKSATKEDSKDIPEEVETVEDVQTQYFEAFGVNVANSKKNDVAWMKEKIAAQAE